MQDLFASFFNLSALTNTKNGHKGGFYAPLRPFLFGEKNFSSTTSLLTPHQPHG